MKAVAGLFDHMNEAEGAVRELTANGFSPENISIVAHDGREERGDKILADSSRADAAGVGATGGAVLGGLAGIVLGLGVLAIPGLGPIIAGGPLIAGLTGASVGAALGGLAGGLTEMGVPEEEARFYAEGVRRGGTLVVVNAAGDHDFTAADIMRRNGAVDIDQRRVEWNGQPEHVQPSRPPAEREPAIASAATLERPATPSRVPQPASQPAYQKEEWDSYCEDHFNRSLAGSGGGYEEYRPAYEYGYHAASDPRFSDHDWEEMETNVRQDWSTRGHGSWDDVKEAIQCGWRCGRGRQAGTTPSVVEGFTSVRNMQSPIAESEDASTGDAFDESAGRRI